MKRPWYITIFCIAAWLWLFILFPSVFSPETKKIHLLLPSIYGIVIALMFVAIVAVWHLKRWGLELFFIILLIKTFLDNSVYSTTTSSNGTVSLNLSSGFVFFFIYGVIIALLFYNKMQKEL